MDRVRRRVKDKRVLRLIRRYLQAGLMTGGLTTVRTEGTPQGGPLSPLLSNILLDDLDKELERRGHAFCRYADDCNIYVRTRRAGERVMASITRFLAERLRLKVNAAKSAVDRPWVRTFLGYTMTAHKQPRLRVAGDRDVMVPEHREGRSREPRGERAQPGLAARVRRFVCLLGCAIGPGDRLLGSARADGGRGIREPEVAPRALAADHRLPALGLVTQRSGHLTSKL